MSEPARGGFVYLGTSPFAVAILELLAARGHRPALVVTPPDRRRGRGRSLSPAPAALAAEVLGIAVHKTESVNQPDSQAAIRQVGAAVAVVCAFGQLIKAPLLDELEILNVHPSLLPRWRGAAPIERALIAGDSETGVAIIRLVAELDAGPIALCRHEPIAPEDNFETLQRRLALIGGELMGEALDRHAAGSLVLTPQDGAGIVYADKIDGSERFLDPARGAAELANRVRGLNPHLGTHLVVASQDGARLGVSVASVAIAEAGLEPGEIAVAEDGARLLLGCGEGSVLGISRVKPAGSREMAVADYLRGRGAPARATLGS